MEGCNQLGKTTIRIIISLIVIICIMLPYSTCFAVEGNENLFTNDRIIDFENEYELQMQLQTLNVKYTGKGILESIYVSQEGWFLLVFSEGTQHHINVFNQACQFISHIIIEEGGKLLAMFDESDNQIILFPIRDHVLIKIDEEANYLSAWSIENDDFSHLVDKLSALNDFEIEAAGNYYSFQGKSVLSKDSQVFSVTNSEGEIIFSYTPGIDIVDENFMLNGILLLAVVFFISFNLLKKKKH